MASSFENNLNKIWFCKECIVSLSVVPPTWKSFAVLTVTMINIENIRCGKTEGKHIILTVHNPHLVILHLPTTPRLPSRQAVRISTFPPSVDISILLLQLKAHSTMSHNVESVVCIRTWDTQERKKKNMFPSLFAILQQFYWDIFLGFVSRDKQSSQPADDDDSWDLNHYLKVSQHLRRWKTGTFWARL